MVMIDRDRLIYKGKMVNESKLVENTFLCKGPNLVIVLGHLALPCRTNKSQIIRYLERVEEY